MIEDLQYAIFLLLLHAISRRTPLPISPTLSVLLAHPQDIRLLCRDDLACFKDSSALDALEVD